MLLLWVAKQPIGQRRAKLRLARLCRKAACSTTFGANTQRLCGQSLAKRSLARRWCGFLRNP